MKYSLKLFNYNTITDNIRYRSFRAEELSPCDLSSVTDSFFVDGDQDNVH